MKTILSTKNFNKLLQIVICFNCAILLVPDQFKGLPIITLLLLVVFRYIKLKDKPILATKTYGISIAFFIILLLSLLYTNNLSYGIKNLETSLSLIAFPTIFYIISGDKKIIDKNLINTLKITFVFSVFFFLLTTFTYFYITEPFYTFKSTLVHYTNLVDIRINYYKIHPIYLSIYIGIAIIFVLSLIEKSKKNKKKLFLAILLILILFIAILNKKGPIISLSIVGFLFLFKNKNNLKKIVSIVLISIVLISAIVFIPKHKNINRFKELLNINQIKNDNNSSTGIRLQIYNCALKQIAQSPLFGYGWGDVKTILNNCYNEKNKNLLNKNYNSHNQFLSILLSSGLIGFLAFTYYLFYLFKTSNNKESQVLFFLVLFFSLNMLTENILEREDGVIVISFLINFYLFSPIDEHKYIKSLNYD